MMKIRSFAFLMFAFCMIMEAMASVWLIPTFPFQTESGKWGFNYHEQSIVPARYDNVVPLSDDSPLFWAQYNGKWGLVNRYGQILIPFTFDDVDVSLQPQPDRKSGYLIKGFSTFDGVAELDEGFLSREWRYIPEDGKVFPLLPVCKDGMWGYVDFEGKTVIDFTLEEAHVFDDYFSNDKKKKRWLAEVKDGRFRMWIDPANGLATDLFDESEIPERFYPGMPVMIGWNWDKWLKKKQLKTKKDWKAYEKEIIDEIYAAQERALRVKPYAHSFSGEIKVDVIKNTGSSVGKSENTRRRNAKKNVRQQAKPEKTSYRVSYAEGGESIVENVDFVFDREGDVLRYKKDGKMSMVNLNTRLTMTYDSIGPFNSYGRALAYEDGVTDTITVDGAILYGEISPLIEAYNQLHEYVDNGNNPDASAAINDYKNLLLSLDNDWYTLQFVPMLRRFVADYNYKNDPAQIAERKRRAEEEEKRQSESNGWGILGDLLSLTGSLSDSQTSQGIKALGETINELAGNSSGSDGNDAPGGTETYNSVTTDMGAINSRISAIDEELKSISEEKTSLARQRLSAKSEVRNSGARAVSPQSGSNLARNASPSRTRQNAKTRAAAQTGARSALSDIDKQIKALTERQDNLMAERNNLVASLNDYSETADDAPAKKTSGKTGGSKAINTGAYSGYQRSLNAIDRDLVNFKEKASNQGLSSSDLSEVKSLKQKARRLREECLKVTGQTLPSNSIENWNP